MPANPAARKPIQTIAAIHPNAGVQAWYQQQLDALLSEAHLDLQLQLSVLVGEARGLPPAEYVQHIPALWTHDIHPAAAVFTHIPDKVLMPESWRIAIDAPPKVTKIDRALQAWGDKWRLRFDKTAKELAKKFAGKSFVHTETSMRAALAHAGFTVKFKTTPASLDAYKGVIAENVNLIKSIPQQYLTGVKSAVWSSVNRGADMASLSKALTQHYGATVNRAALISRDQNNKAKAVIENARRRELGITQAIWQHSSAGKEPRPAHVAMNGKVFDLKRGMWDPDEQEWIYPGQLINCRCTSRAIIPGLNNV